MNGVRVNIRNMVYAPLTKDTATVLEYGAVKSIPGAMTITLTPTTAAGDLYGDGVKKHSLQSLTGYDIAVELNKLPFEVRAEWLGNTIGTDGVLVEKETDKPIDFAFGFEADLTEGRECLWIVKVTASPITNNMQQRTDNINYSTDSLTLKAKFRMKDGAVRFFGDTSAEGGKFTEEDADTFFDSVPGATTP